jgi:UDP-N-acetylglucosamine acyltransferase
MAASHVGHDAHIQDGVIMANSALIGGHAVIGNNAFISGNVSVHQHVHIGSYAMVSASTFITQDIPPWCMAQGTPGRVVGLNSVGLRRNGFSSERKKNIKALFRLLYRSNMPFAAIKKAIAAIDDDDARALFAFLEASRRGIVGTRRGIVQHVSE